MKYRLYLLDPSGRTNRATETDYANDDDAIAGADEERGASDAELWCGKTMVTKFRRVVTHYR